MEAENEKKQTWKKLNETPLDFDAWDILFSPADLVI